MPSGAVGRRPWHAVWPPHLQHSLDYPYVPGWWILERNLPRFASRVALREIEQETLVERRTLTYEALMRAARGAATGLREAGVERGARVGLCLPNGVALVVGYYATWWAGATAVPANPRARETEVAQQFDDAGVSVVVGVPDGPGEWVAADRKIPFIDVDAFAAMEAWPVGAPAPCDPASDVAALLYTGGTTGTPKGAMLTHRNVVANTIQFAEWYTFVAGEETVISAIPCFHSGGMSGVMNVPLYTGATALMFPRFKAVSVAEACGRYGVTRLFGVPTMYIALMNDEAGRRADYSRLRACRTSASPLPPRVKAAFDALVGREVLVEGYGLTETSPLTHANPVARPKAGSIGVPLPDTDARIVDLHTGRDVAAGESGELLVRGPQVMKGYWNAPVDTAAAMSDGWLRTGDVAVMDAEGYFAIVDRKKDVINTAGFKVWPREVEEVLYAHDGVKLAAVVGVADDYRGEAVKAFVVLKDGACPAEQDLVNFCAARLSSYKVPRAIEFRAELPTSGAGKLLRRALREESEGKPGP